MLVISRDVAIVLTVAVVNLAVGPRTFRPSIYGKIATATFVITGVVALYFNYLEQPSPVVTVFVYASLAITVVSAFHYGLQVHQARVTELDLRSDLRPESRRASSSVLLRARPSAPSRAACARA